MPRYRSGVLSYCTWCYSLWSASPCVSTTCLLSHRPFPDQDVAHAVLKIGGQQAMFVLERSLQPQT